MVLKQSLGSSSANHTPATRVTPVPLAELQNACHEAQRSQGVTLQFIPPNKLKARPLYQTTPAFLPCAKLHAPVTRVLGSAREPDGMRKPAQCRCISIRSLWRFTSARRGSASRNAPFAASP